MILRLHEAVAAVCPIDGVSGRQGNVRVDYKPEATQPQRDAAAAVVAAFDWSQAAHDAWLEDQHPQRKTLRQQAAAAVQGNLDFLAIGSPTAAQVRDQVRALTQQNNRIIQRLVQVD